MKKTLLIFAFITATLSIVAQNNKVDKRLLAKYTAEEINNIKADTPEEYTFLTYCIENAFYIAEMPAEKIKANPTNFGEIMSKNMNKINFGLYTFSKINCIL